MATASIARGGNFSFSLIDDPKYRAAIEAANKAADAIRAKKKEQDIQDQERAFSLSKRGLDAKTDAQSRLQKERTEQSSKLQTQAAAEAAARKAGDRAAAIANFRSRGGSKMGR